MQTWIVHLVNLQHHIIRCNACHHNGTVMLASGRADGEMVPAVTDVDGVGGDLPLDGNKGEGGRADSPAGGDSNTG